ncbi:MAG: glycosyltransferase family 9 protein [Xanthomonadales bacterium]|nr:glycosyltransferase family 9 protein [Xanthomonadales bacterium]NNK51009.1 glycosyltransferase family 9 protein [Xanthomonadales bacterium]
MRRLCILRLSALGDATHVVPVIRAIQDSRPDTEITWVIGRQEHQLLSGMEEVEFIVFDKRGGWSSVKALREALRDRRFDALFHMQVAARANLLSRMIRAPIRLGWDRARSRDFHHHFTRHRIAEVPFQHQVQGFLEFARAVGVDAAEPRWDLPVTPEAHNWAGARVPGDEPVLLISPCSSHERRNWSSRNYATVADYAIHELGMQVVLSGGPSELERRVANEIVAAMSGSCIDLVGKDTLEQSKALLKLADLVISPDSGPAHVASALGTPVIGLYAATWSKRSGPYNSLYLCVDRFEQAARKFRESEATKLRWGTKIEEPGVMDLIQPEDVIRQMQTWKELNS